MPSCKFNIAMAKGPCTSMISSKKKRDFPRKNRNVPGKNRDFPSKNRDVPGKAWDFPSKNIGNCLANTGDFSQFAMSLKGPTLADWPKAEGTEIAKAAQAEK